jgi:hypothetical protein
MTPWLMRGSTCGQMRAKLRPGFLEPVAYHARHNRIKTRGRIVELENNTLPEQQGFTTEDILWAVGIWSVLLTMSPVVVFYMLMVA